MATDPGNGVNDKEKDDGQKGQMKYKNNLTVNIELLGEERIPTIEVISNVRMLCGGLLACRSVGPRKFEITMSNEKGKDRLLDGFKIGDTCGS